jgi:hypothetical protein
MEACASLHLGQAVRFVDFRSGQLRQGKVIAKHPTQATVFEESTMDWTSRTTTRRSTNVDPLRRSAAARCWRRLEVS